MSLFTGRNVLVIGVHPDDLEYCILGTLLKYRKEMNTLCCYIATIGGEGDISNGFSNRKVESNKALQCIHPDFIIWEDRIGIKMDDYSSEVHYIEDIVNAHCIDMVLTTSPHDTHQEHRLLSEITMTVLRRTNTTVLCYGFPSNTLDFHPRVFVDISRFMNAKLKALRLHKSQCGKPYLKLECLASFHSDPYSFHHGMSHVERFEVERICI